MSKRRKPEHEIMVERLASVSHELRTPLNGILGLSQLLLQMKPTPEQREYLEMIRGSGVTLLTVLNDILDYSRIHGVGLRLDAEPFHVRRWMRQCVKTLAPQAHGKGLELAYWVEPEVPGVIVADAIRLQQVLVNLIVNAIKYTDEGEVVVEASLLERSEDITWLRLSVRDTGIGIPGSRHQAIFEPFAQLSSRTSECTGLGLGLAISSEIMDQMGGVIRVESEPGTGSLFQVEIPVRVSSDVDEEERSTVSLDGIRALLIDDNEVQRALLERQLRLWGVEVTATGCAETALAALSLASYSFVLIDSKMPGIDVFGLAEDIQELRPIPGVLMTSAQEHVEPEVLRSIGIVGQLSKPVAPSQLLRAIEIIRRGQTAQKTQVPPSAFDPLPLKGLRVLVAEDDPVNRTLTVRALEKNGADVVAVTNGAEALRMTRDDGFDAAVLDLEMPELDGLSAARRIRLRERASGLHLALVATTAHERREVQNLCRAAGMDGFLPKPFEEMDLVRAVQAEARGEIFDRDAALKRAQGDASLLSELVSGFLTDFPQDLAILASEIDKKQFSRIERLSHRLKGSLLTLAAERAAREALALEASARGEDAERCRIAFDRLQAELRRFEAQLRSWRVPSLSRER
ncbi:MAG TPA: response regulator [Vicinamibacteria bacterium]|nr:response regulator [Vicinamibacteria bacterium]